VRRIEALLEEVSERKVEAGDRDELSFARRRAEQGKAEQRRRREEHGAASRVQAAFRGGLARKQHRHTVAAARQALAQQADNNSRRRPTLSAPFSKSKGWGSAKKKFSAVALLRAAASPKSQRRGSYDPDSKAASAEAQRKLAGAFADARLEELAAAERTRRKQQVHEDPCCDFLK